jgi:hypothetical protein
MPLDFVNEDHAMKTADPLPSSSSKPTEEILWNHYALQVDLYKEYLDLLLKFNVFYYAATGAFLSYYFAHSALPLMRYALIFPLVMSFGFAVLFIFAASQTPIVRRELFAIRDKLGLDTAPEYLVLTVFLLLSALLLLVVACGIGTLMYHTWHTAT